MGVVVTAYDPKLDRKVAVKLLRAEPQLDGVRRKVRRARLVREAQALARLNHPNVIAVHDVDVSEGIVYMAMEYVEGSDVVGWLERRSRSWRDIVDVFVAAGRGLSAAHEAGITHRDFKPTNVLVGLDGRVRVVDFGLAKHLEPVAVGSSDEHERPEAAQSLEQEFGGLEPTPRSDKLTQAGRCVGTPAYMAPEQQVGEDVGPAADQFSFAVALFEALYGTMPFGEDDESFWRVIDGKICAPPPKARVPASLYRVLCRAMQPVVSDRFASMDELITALVRCRVARRGRWWVGASVALTLLAGGTAAWAMAPGPCHRDLSAVDSVWNERRFEEIEQRVSSGGDQQSSLARLHTTLQEWTEKWSATRVDVCQATREAPNEARSQMDPRTTCLDEQRVEVAAMVHALETEGPQVLERVLDGLEALEEPQSCLRRAAFDPSALPEDEDERREVQAVRLELARVRGMQNAGLHRDALAAARVADERARGTQHRPTFALATVTLGRSLLQAHELDAAESTLREAILQAAAVGEARNEFDALAGLIHIVGVERGDAGEAAGLEQGARAVLERVRADAQPELRVWLDRTMAIVEIENGRLDEGEARLQRARRTAEEQLGPEHRYTADVLGELGSLRARRGSLHEARTLLERASEMIEHSRGASHSTLATVLRNLGNVELLSERHERALELYRRARAILVASEGLEHVSVDEVDLMIAYTRSAQGRWIEALSELDRVIDRLRDRSAAGSFASALTQRGRVHLALERYELASNDLEAARETLVALRGPEHPALVELEVELCRVALDRDRPEEAERWADHAHRSAERSDGATAHELGARVCRAGAWQRLGRTTEAQHEVRAGVAMWREQGRSGSVLEIELPLAELAWSLVGVRSDAVAMLQRVDEAVNEGSPEMQSPRARRRLAELDPRRG